MTEDIIELSEDLSKNHVELKKKVTGILSLISTLNSYSNKKKIDMLPFMQYAQLIFESLKAEVSMPRTTRTMLEIFCNFVNSITFDFGKKGLRLNIHQIDFSILKTGL